MTKHEKALGEPEHLALGVRAWGAAGKVGRAGGGRDAGDRVDRRKKLTLVPFFLVAI